MAKQGRGSGALWRYLLVRFVLIFPTIFILVTVVFFLMRAAGDPITAAQGGKLTPDQLAEKIHLAGYDRPLIVQYLEYLGHIATGNFGTTLSDNLPITTVITRYGAATFELAVYALIVALIVGIPLGTLAAYIRDRWGDAVLRVLAVVFYATPIFFSGLLLKLVFAIWLHVLPVAGRATTSSELKMQLLPHATGIDLIDAFQTGDGRIVGDVLWHAVLPAVTLGLLTAGVFLRLVRTNVIATFNTPYVDAARSRGVGEYRLLTLARVPAGAHPDHHRRRAPGRDAPRRRGAHRDDLRVARARLPAEPLPPGPRLRRGAGIVALVAVIVAVVNFVVDAIAALIDPRVRY